jgi:U8 snoRNA-decapping enzyme
MTVIPVDINTKIDNKRQAAFVILYARNGKPWAGYEGKESLNDLEIPTCLMINRSDGCIGFVGGMVEDGETLEQAAKREVLEEIGYKIARELVPLIAHDVGQITTHAFTLELDYEELRAIQKLATQSDHFGSELTGVFLPHLIDYEPYTGKKFGLPILMQQKMAPSVLEELESFITEVLS